MKCCLVTLLHQKKLFFTKILRHSIFRWSPACSDFSNNYSSYVNYLSNKPLERSTVGSVFEKSTNNWPNIPFLISEHESLTLTYSQVLEEANKFASGLLNCGLQPGDRFGICSTNSTKWFIMLLGAVKIGLIIVAINPANTTKELKYCINKAGLKAVAFPSKTRKQDYYSAMQMMAPEIMKCKPGELNSNNFKNLKTIIIMDNEKLNGTFTYSEILNLGQLSTSLYPSVSPDSDFSILFSSGTTGLPKAAVHSHFSYTNNSKEIGLRLEMDEKHKTMCFQIPFFHAFGLLTVLSAFHYGSTIVLPSPSFSVEESINTILKNRCDLITGTPTMYVDMIKYQNDHNIAFNVPSTAVTAGAPCSPQLFRKTHKYLNIQSLKSIYGTTETLGVFQGLLNENDYQAIETVGKIMSHLEVKITDKSGNILPMGSSGELLVKGYSNMKYYWDDERKTAEIFDNDGWLRTGDQFTLDSDGYGKITGRFKDIIIRGGENIFPKEVEDYINMHPDVIESQVFGVKDDRLGEEVCASIRIRQGSSFDYDTLKKYCEGTLAYYKIPKFLKIVEDFPKTASGKIQKYKLKELVENGKL